MKAAIYNPYWDTLGGGERYTISFAKVLAEGGYQVDIEWKNKNLPAKIDGRFGIKINNLKIVDSIKKGEGYDLCFWVSDGSIPLLHSRNNYIHFQVPFKDVNGKTLLNRMKLFRIKKIICNSEFTKNIIDNEYGIQSVVVYPPCDTGKIKPKRKENIILNVGRFSNLLQSKHQDVLVDAFIKMCKNGLVNWRLILAGGTDVGAKDVLVILKKKITGYPIEILEGPSYKEIVNLYGISKIFWSASGWGVNENKDPDKVEHFGIAVVEGMSAGAVPVVIDSGGHKEIVGKESGFLWSKTSELVKITKGLISDAKYLRSISKNAVVSSARFSYEKFKETVENILP